MQTMHQESPLQFGTINSCKVSSQCSVLHFFFFFFFFFFFSTLPQHCPLQFPVWIGLGVWTRWCHIPMLQTIDLQIALCTSHQNPTLHTQRSDLQNSSGQALPHPLASCTSLIVCVALRWLIPSSLTRFPYCRLKTVTISGRVVTLNPLEDDASVKMRNYELSSKRSADCLYRSITELHCFFRCDNIRDDVLNRTNPSINFATIFDHNNSECIVIGGTTCHVVMTAIKW
ncbi:E3 ubiquitin protein ligase MYLIP A [Echinococcus multilocularis]|uniref:E3 ubiquitin protein ligase MYLIP A n=1 Tax=Echinococcus multilocularis TaxID=6211 RepID=A0A068Y5Z5_ECHMU|nr:E3 ubiquitin protein ligase MYLIP A [Echinococcus multilocularis]